MRALRAGLIFLYTCLLYLGIPLLGWGLGDLRGFFAEGPRLLYSLAVVAFGIGVMWQTRHGMEGVRGGKGQAEKLVRKQSLVRYGMSLLLFASLALLPLADRRGLAVMSVGAPIRWIGAILSAAGLALVFWSGVALGRQYSPEVTIQQDHQLIATGPYRIVRHPRYLGVILMGGGVPLLFRSWIGPVLWLALLIVLVDRIRDEESLLHQEFGPAWEAYEKRSWRLIPYLY